MNGPRSRWAVLPAAVAASVVLAACGPGGPSTSGTSPAAGSEGAAPSPLVDPSEIRSGGPPPDGIPPIDDPKFVRANDVDFLDPKEPVIWLEVDGDARAYAAQILIWHEIVNDVVGGVPVVVTYCPLCNTGVAFERPTIDGRLLDFGTSGKLYKSNLVMYDRQTESLWPQVLGQAVVGPLTGTTLEQVPVQMVSWGDWKGRHPDGRVLSLETGTNRPYGTNPYVGYDSPDTRPFLFNEDLDPRLPPKARVVGVRVGSDVIAFPYEELRKGAVDGWAAVEAVVGDRPLVAFWKSGTVSAVNQRDIRFSVDVGATGVFDARLDGRELTFETTPEGVRDRQTESTWDIFGRAVDGPLTGRSLSRVVAIESFWFDWAAFFPETRIFRG